MNTIPEMTDPLGRYWKQPPTNSIVIDDTHAAMDKKTFDALPEYSCSIPSGVYPGKMWRRENGAFDKEFLKKGGKTEWMLMWYGVSNDPQMCSINHRKILVI